MASNASGAVTDEADVAPKPQKRKFEFPSAITVLVIVTIFVWIAAIFIPAGQYEVDDGGAPIAGTFQEVDSPLSFGERVQQLIRAPINGVYGIKSLTTGFVDTENVGALFGSIGVVVFILALGIFIAVSFETRSLEVAVSSLGKRLRDKGWLLITVIMVLFSALGSTMGFSVETFGFYALLIPLMAALGYDRMVTAGMVILGALTGSMASTVNPFSIGVASGEAGVSIGDGIVLRIVLWAILTATAIAFVLRYANRIRKDPSRSIVGFEDTSVIGEELHPDEQLPDKLSGVQKWVLAITGGTFMLLVFSVIPWSSIFGSVEGAADAEILHATTAEPYWFELGWWFPQLSMLFVLAAFVIALVARMGEKKFIGLVTRGAADMIGPAIVIVLARGVAVIMNNTQTLDTVLNAMERAVSGTSAGVFTVLVALVNMPLAFLIPSSSGHATLAMPLISPLADFAGVSRPLSITAFQMGHGLMLLFSPTNFVLVGGLAIAGVGYNKYLKFVWPLLVAFAIIISAVLVLAAVLE